MAVSFQFCSLFNFKDLWTVTTQIFGLESMMETSYVHHYGTIILILRNLLFSFSAFPMKLNFC